MLQSIGRVHLAALSLLAFSACSLSSDNQVTTLLTSSTVQAMPTTVAADGVSSSKVTVTALGLGNQPASGIAIYIASTLAGSNVHQPTKATDANGQAFASVTSTVAGRTAISARLGGASGSVVQATDQVEFVTAGAAAAVVPLRVAVVPGQAQADENATLTVTVQGPVGAAVAFAGALATDLFSPPSAVLDATGVATASWRARQAGSRTLTATTAGESATAGALFVAGPADANGCALQGPGAKVVADGIATAAVTVTVTDFFGNPVASEPVSFAFAPPSPGALALPTSGITDGTGRFVTQVSSTTPGLLTVQATTAGTALQAPLTFVAGPAVAGNCLLLSSPALAVANGNDSILLTLLAHDALGHPTPGRAVTFAGSGASVVLSPPLATTDAAGQANVTVTATVAANMLVFAHIDLASVSSQLTFVAGPLDGNQSTFSLQPNRIVAGPPTAVATVLARDAYGNAIAGLPVVFTSTGAQMAYAAVQVATDLTGQANALLGSVEAGSFVVTASLPSLALTASLAVESGAANANSSTLTLQATDVVADGLTAVPIEVALADAYGNAIAHFPLTLVSSEPTDVFGPANGNSDLDGTFASTLRATKAGVRTLTMAAAPISLQGAATFVAGPLSVAQSTLVASPNAVVADDATTSTITVRAFDAQLNPLVGLAVAPALSGSGATLSPPSGATDANGFFVMMAHGHVAGAQLLTAYLGNQNASISTSLHFVAGAPNAIVSTLTVSPNTLAANGVTTASLTATLLDRFGNAIFGQPIAIAVSGASTLAGGASGSTSATGSFAATVASTQASQRTVSATSGAIALIAPLTFVPNAASSGASALKFAPTSLVADDQAITYVTVTVRDSYNNPVGSTPVSLTSSGSANGFGQTSGTTDANGLFSTTLHSHVAESKQVSANLLGGASETAAVVFVAGNANSAASSLQIQPSTTEAGLAVSVEAVFADAFGNPAAGQNVAFASTDANDAFYPAAAKTNVAGVASTTLSSTHAGTNTITASAAGASAAASVTITAASPDSQVSSLVVSPNVQVADGTSLVALTARVFDAHQNPIGGQAIVLLSDAAGGTDLFAPPSGTTTAQGSFFSTLTAQVAGTHTISFLLDGNVLSATVSFVAGTPDPAQSSVSISPPAVHADNAALASVVALARDHYGNPVSGYPVVLTASGTTNTFAAASGSTDLAGSYATTLQSATAQNKTITASFGTLATAQNVVTFIPGGVDAGASTLALSPNAIVADGASATSVAVSAIDPLGNPVAGVTVSLATTGTASFVSAHGTTDATGAFATTARGTLVDAEVISVTLDGLTGPTAALTMLPGAPNATLSSLSLSPSAVADGATRAAVVVVVVDAFGNPVPNLALTLHASGMSAALSPNQAVSDGNGAVHAGLVDTVAEVVTVTVGYGSTTLSGSIPFVAGPASATTSTLTASPNSITANNTAISTLTAALRDVLGNPVGGVAVTLASAGSGDTIVAANGNTDPSGRYATTLTTTLAETKSISFSLADGNVTTTLVSVAGSPNSAMSSLAPTPPTQSADGVSLIMLTGTIRDRYGNPINNRPATFTSSNAGGNDSFSLSGASTNAAGQITTALRSNKAEAKTITMSASPAAAQTGVSFLAGPPGSARSTLAISPNGVVADGVAASTVTVIIRDAFGNTDPNQAIFLSSNSNADTLGLLSGTTNASGAFVTSLKSTRAEMKTITATAGAATVSGFVAFVPGAPSAGQSSLTASPNVFVADTVATTTIALLAADAFGNPTPAAAVGLSSSNANDLFALLTSSTDANGAFVTTMTTSRAEAKTITAHVGNVTVTTTATSVAGAANQTSSALSLAPTGLMADGNAATTILVTVRDAYSNPIAGQAVAFASSGSSDVIASPTGQTAANGAYASTLTATVTGARSVTATVGSFTLSGNVSFGAGLPSNVTSTLASSPDPFVADNVSTSSVVVMVYDRFLNAVSSQLVTLSSTGSGDTLAAPSGTTDGTGRYATTLRSSVAQTRTLTANLGSTNLTTTATSTAGSPNATQSILSVSPNSLTAASTTTVTFTVRDRFSNVVASMPVAFASSNGNDVVGSPTTSTSLGGVATSTLSSTKAETKIITATAGPMSLTASVAFVAGLPSSSFSSVAASPNAFVADNVATTTIITSVADAYANPVQAANLTLSSSGVGDSFANALGTTTQSGTYQTTLRSTTAQTKLITATLAAGNGNVTTVVTATAGSANTTMSTLGAGPNPQVADNVSVMTLTATVRDKYANAVVNQNASVSTVDPGGNNTISPASVATDANGQATFTLRSNRAENKTVALLAGTASPQTSVTFLAGPATTANTTLALSPNGVVADYSSTTTATVTVRDQFGNVVPLQWVMLTSSTPSDTFGVANGNTTAGGIYTTTLKAMRAETKTITAVAANANVSSQVTFIAGSPNATLSSITASPNSIVANNVATSTLTITALDGYSNTLASANVTLSSNAVGDTFSGAAGTTSPAGTYTTTITATKSGARTLTALVGTASLTTLLVGTAGSPNSAYTTLAISPNGLVADGASTATFTATVKDLYNNVVPAYAVSLSSSNGNDVIASPSGSTDGNGRYVTTMTATKAETKTIAVTAGAASASATVAFTAGSPNVTTSSITVSPSSFVADNATTGNVVVLVRDQYANPVASQNVALSSAGSSDTFASSSGSTDANGRFATTLRSSVAQTRTLSAAVGNGNVTTSATTTAGTPSATLSTLSVSPNSQTVAAIATVTLTVRDQFSNLVGGQNVSFVSSNGNDLFGSPATATSFGGVASTTLVASKAEAKTITATASPASLTATVTYVAGAPNATMSSVSGSPVPTVADGNQAMSLVANARDAFANPVAGVSIAWSAGGQTNTLSSTSSTTAANGGSPAVMLRSTKAEVKTVAAAMTLNANGYGSAQANLRFVGGAAVATQSNMTVLNPNSGVVWGNANITVTFSAVDQYGNGSPNQTVKLASTTKSDTFSSVPGYTDANGLLVSSVAGIFYGPRTISASIGGTPRSARIQFASRAAYCTGTPRMGSSPSLFFTGLLAGFAMPDINNDGYADLVLLNSAANTLVSYRSKGNGLFSAPTSYGLNCSPNSLVARDLGNDNYVDIAVGCNDANALRILTNDQNGGFVVSTTPSMTSAASGVAAGLLNNDTLLDLVAFNANTGLASSYINQGNNAFSLTSSLVVGGTPVDAAIGDLNGDGFGDVVFAQFAANQVIRYFGNATGVLSSGAGVLSGTSPVSLALGLLDGDLKLDIVAKMSGDTNDLVGLGTGTGAFNLVTPLSVGHIGIVRMIDVDQDGILDLVSSFNGENLYIGRNNGSAAFTLTNPGAYGNEGSGGIWAMGDINGDGYGDFAQAYANTYASSISFTFGVAPTPGKYFETSVMTAYLGNNAQTMVVDDFDRDGIADLAAASVAGAVSVAYGAGDGNFPRVAQSVVLTGASTGVAPGERYVTKGDLNGDGVPDLVTSSTDPNNPGVLTFVNDGGGNFPVGFLVPVNAYSSLNIGMSMGVADFDQDGIADILVAATAGSTMLYLHGLGNGNFIYQRTIANNTSNTGVSIAYIKTGDFNADGIVDVLVAQGSVQGLRLFVANGNGTFNPNVVESSGISTAEPVVVDVNGDGNLDILVGTNFNTGQATYIVAYLGAGNSNFSQTITSPILPFVGTYAAAGDFNGDGFVDLVLCQDRGKLFTCYGDGTGSFAFTSGYGSAINLPRGVGAGDFDQDGKMDFAVAGYLSGYVGVALNRGCLQ